MTLLLASARTEVADYLSAVIEVYALLIVFFVILQVLFSFGVRLPYSRASDAVFTFLGEICNPYLRLFRRLIPMFGALDLSPIVALVVLQLVNALIVRNLIHG